MHFLVDLAIVVRHLRFGGLPETLVTLIGLAAMLKGSMLIAVPELALRLPKTGKAALRTSGVGFATVGVYLGYVSYF